MKREIELRKTRREAFVAMKGLLKTAVDEGRGLTPDEQVGWGEHQATLRVIDRYLANGGIMSEWGNVISPFYDGSAKPAPAKTTLVDPNAVADQLYLDMYPGWPLKPSCWDHWRAEWERTGAVYALDRMRMYLPPPECLSRPEPERRPVTAKIVTKRALPPLTHDRICARIVLAIVALSLIGYLITGLTGGPW